MLQIESKLYFNEYFFGEIAETEIKITENKSKALGFTAGHYK